MSDLAVIMSVYHADRLLFVKEAVESILNQDFRTFDFYLAFDGPVAEDVDKYISSIADSRLSIHRLEKNKGLAFALNYLLELVMSRPEIRYIARMDADDISLPERLGTQRKFLIENPEINVLGSWYEEIDEAGKVLRQRKLPPDHEGLRKRYFTRTPFAHPSVMYRRELIEVAGYYPEDTCLMEDNVLWGRALIRGLKFANIQESLLKFRITDDFFRRRSGIYYGWKFICTKLKTNRELKVQFHNYLLSLLVGLVKMMPGRVVKIFY
jgi:hypothetical protein